MLGFCLTLSGPQKIPGSVPVGSQSRPWSLYLLHTCCSSITVCPTAEFFCCQKNLWQDQMENFKISVDALRKIFEEPVTTQGRRQEHNENPVRAPVCFSERPKEYEESHAIIHERSKQYNVVDTIKDVPQEEEGKFEKQKGKPSGKKAYSVDKKELSPIVDLQRKFDKAEHDKGQQKKLEVQHKKLLEEHQKKLEVQHKKLEALQRKFDKAEHDKEVQHKKLEEHQKKLEALQRKFDKAEHDKEVQHKKLEALQRKFDKAEHDKEEQQRKLEVQQKKLEDQQKKLEALQRKFDKAEHDKEVQQKKLDKGEHDKEEQQKKIEEQHKKLEALQRKFEKPVITHDEEEKEKNKTSVDALQKKIEELQTRLDRTEATFKSAWKKALLHADWKKEESKAVNVTLDAATAHPALLLSEDGKQVTWKETCQDLPSFTERFISVPCVLGQQDIRSGRVYWEVEVGDTHSWDLGICRDNVKRKGGVTISPQNGFWAIRLYDGEYWALTSPETLLTLRERPLRVGIFLDYEAGDVSFCNMTDGSHIFTFPQNTFSGVLRPLFRLWPSGSGSLTIVHVEEKR